MYGKRFRQANPANQDYKPHRPGKSDNNINVTINYNGNKTN